MLHIIFVLSFVGLAGDAEELAGVLKKATGWDGYTFTVEEQPGSLEAKYEKGKPLWCKADRLELFKKGDVVAYKDGDKWLRSRTGTLSDPLRVLGAVAKVRTARLPHEELPAIVKAAGAAQKEKERDGGLTVYSARLGREAARALARSENQSVAREGTARFWVDADGRLVKYELTIRLQGRIGGAEVDGTVRKTVTLSAAGKTRVDVPAEAGKALE